MTRQYGMVDQSCGEIACECGAELVGRIAYSDDGGPLRCSRCTYGGDPLPVIRRPRYLSAHLRAFNRRSRVPF